MGVNLRGGVRDFCASAGGQCGRHGGAIVAVTSVSGFLSERMMAHYSVSKAGLAALVKIATHELGPLGIRVPTRWRPARPTHRCSRQRNGCPATASG